ncbi:TonB-dependent receptor domain-containing protein [Steroidobacter flavus]|uniref:TonB-dependent receptor domain-containing protein n=1 Tax=Steroidobacter flavus TaxID=1842136 RepID=A0ABV8SLX8_9GAMM
MSAISRAVRVAMRLRVGTALLCTLLSGAALAAPELGDEMRQFDIAAGDLVDALDSLASQSGLQIMYDGSTSGREIKVAAVNGELTTNDALARLLVDTGLEVARVNARTVVLRQAPQRRTTSTMAVASVAPRAAMSEESAPVEEVTVTARKREERLQDVPASIAAATGETIAQLNIVNVTEMDAVAPGLTFVSNPSRFGSGPSIALRGISTQTQSSGVQDSVGIVIDGVPISRAKAGAFPDLSDTSRVEILRGPQGTLFGKNASAGVISITTKDPTERPETELAVGYGTHNEQTFTGSVSGPVLDDKLTGRLAAYRKSRDGFVENVYDGSEWEVDDQVGFRGKLLFKPTDVDALKLSADYVEQKNDAGTNIIRAFTPVTPQYVRDSLGSIVGPENDKINAHSLGVNRHQSGGAALQWDRDIGEHTLTALGAYRFFEQDFHQGTYAWLTPLNDGDVRGFTDLDQYSTEVRLASPSNQRLQYVAGLFAMTDNIEVGLWDPAPGLLVVGTTTRTARNYVNEVETLNYAAFAEANLEVTDHFGLTSGLRWTHETVDATITGKPTPDGARRAGHPLGTTSDSATASKVSWKVGGQWRIDADRMFYVSVATGFKGPGFNVNSTVLGDAQPVRPETSTSYEAGWKSQFWGRRLTLNLSAFHARFEDFQTQGGLVLPGNPNARIILLNADEVRTQGVELELAAALGQATELRFNGAYIDAQFENFPNAPCYPEQSVTTNTCVGNVQDLSGARLPNTPEWNFNVSARQEFPLFNWRWHGFATVDYSWRSDVQWNALGSPNGIEDGYGLLGASFGLRSDDSRIVTKIYGKNLTDQFHTSGIVVDNQVTHFLPPDYSRIVGIDMTLSF